ncbi:MAG: hypothetical protein WHX93_17280 [bacterium]
MQEIPKDQLSPGEDGWTRQFVASEPRLSEAVELYRSLGLEVRLEPVSPGSLEGECLQCLEAAPDRFKVIYTRPVDGG